VSRCVCAFVWLLLSFPLVIAQEKPAPLEFSRWSGEINVPDPVAISFDEQGRAYVTQTQRRKANDLDIRQNSDWVQNDLQFQSIEEKQAFYRSRLAPGADPARNAKRVKDLNGDASHDYRDLMVLSEIIHRLEDTDGDGVADRTHVFADGFQTEVTGIAAGVLHHQGHVYATIAPDVWQLKDSDADGAADQRIRMATGFGLHIAYGGHDMHGLTVGPDGKIYWSIGDKGISASDQKGKRYHYPNQGGVMRCNPDGSDFEVFAHGLRNVQELAFDQYGNLFGVDNDADQPNERERFVYIVPGMDAGWRFNYQHRGGEYNPWTVERLWVPYFEGQAAHIVPPISHSINGPAGFAFNPGTALSPAYKNYFFLTGAPGGEQIAFQTKPNGASFQMVNEHKIGSGIPLVGIAFAPDGALYGVDWGGGYPLNQTGAVWKIDDPKSANSPARTEVADLLRRGFEKEMEPNLVRFLSHADQRVRLAAQFELAQRNLIATLTSVALDKKAEQLSRIHAIWGAGQILRAAASDFPWDTLLADTDAEIVKQAVRTIADLPSIETGVLAGLLHRPASARIRLQTMLALARHPDPEAFPRLVELAKSQNVSESYLRHGVSFALAACGNDKQLAALHLHASPVVRLCAVIACRHRRTAAVTTFLGDSDGRIVDEAARAIHDDFSIPAALPALAALIEQPTKGSEVAIRRAVHANLRLGETDAATRLARYSVNSAEAVVLRVHALAVLGDWLDNHPLDRVTGRFRDYPLRSEIDSTAVLQAIGPLLVDPAVAIRQAAMKTMRSLKLEIPNGNLIKLALDESTPETLIVEALDTLHSQQANQLPNVLPVLLKSEHRRVKIRAIELYGELAPNDAFSPIRNIFVSSDDAIIQQQAIRSINTLAGSQPTAFLINELRKIEEHVEDSPYALELIEAVESRRLTSPAAKQLSDGLANRLVKQAAKSPEMLMAMSLTGGQPLRGKEIFNTHLQAQCVRCHRVGKQGSTVGPRLDKVAAKRDARYLLRAIVAPSAEIDEKYRTLVVILESGKSLTGVKVSEDKDTLIIADATGKTHEINRDEIDEQIEQKVSIMPAVKEVLTPANVRDLVSYLKTLK
jgi:quinoprotein glucose dehydrogenase